MPPFMRGHFSVALGGALVYLAVMRNFRWVLVALSVAALVLPAYAQKLTPKKISFEGTTASQAELLAVMGLKPGASILQADMQAGAQKLMDTGMFADVHFTYDGVDLHYAITPATDVMPVHYANFPWWDEASLNAAVAAKVMLFHGGLPMESSLIQPVTDALTALLAAKGVQATVTETPEPNAGKDTGIQFHIDAPAVEMGPVTFTGASSAWAEPVGRIQTAAAGHTFDSAAEATLFTALRAIYHRQGYLEMAMNGFAHGDPQVVDGKVMVPVSATIVEGSQYRVASITLAGGSLMSPEDFAKLAKLKAGDVANEDLLRGTMAGLVRPYKAHGYMDVKIDAAPRFDAENHTVTYAVTVVPGPIYHMGELSLVGLNEQQRAEVLKYWPLQEGDVYDATVSTDFLLKNKAVLKTLAGWSGGWKAYAHEDTHVVDLVVTFVQGGVLQ
ncbi:MAG TPA: POTRA domain-containing protein, partial [Acidobacteriaceae bacterium]|nr:POTRA domain-containing protein [Acidobacteriaceae bacterium]